MTAVEWLKQQYIERGETLPSGVFQEALEKEKEQIIDAYYGNIDGVFGYREAGEEYYNQTYNQKQHIIDIMKADENDGLYKMFDTDSDKKH
jgi:hypothetical protein